MVDHTGKRIRIKWTCIGETKSGETIGLQEGDELDCIHDGYDILTLECKNGTKWLVETKNCEIIERK